MSRDNVPRPQTPVQEVMAHENTLVYAHISTKRQLDAITRYLGEQ